MIFIMRLGMTVMTLVSGIVAIGLLGLMVGAFLNPTSSLWAVIGSSVWAAFGPFLLVAAFSALALGLVAHAYLPSRLGSAVLLLAAFGVIGALFILGRIGLAAHGSGASVNVLETFCSGVWTNPPRMPWKFFGRLMERIYMRPSTGLPRQTV